MFLPVEDPIPNMFLPVEESAPDMSLPLEEPVPTLSLPVKEPTPDMSLPMEEPAVSSQSFTTEHPFCPSVKRLNPSNPMYLSVDSK